MQHFGEVVCQVVVDVRLIRKLAAMASLQDDTHNRDIGDAMRSWHGLTESAYPDPQYVDTVSYSVYGVLGRYGLDFQTCLPKDADPANLKAQPLPALVYGFEEN